MEAEELIEAAGNLVLTGVKDHSPHTQQSEMATKEPYEKESEVTPKSLDLSTDGSRLDDSKSKCETQKCKGGTNSKNKRNRRRGKPKANTKPYKKSNWRFQMPRYRNGNCMSSKLVRSRCIVPYNTNGFLMDEHLAEVPSALLTPSGRTRDSSFSVDSEDNYFFSLPEDEEEFLTKDFDNAYEKTRVERLENMSKQQLIEECLQLEDRSGLQQATTIEFLNKIRSLEDRIRELANENQDLRRKLDSVSKNSTTVKDDRICSSASEDSESDSSTSSSSSCGSSICNSRCSLTDTNESRMDCDYTVSGQNNPIDQVEPSNMKESEDCGNCNGYLGKSSPDSKGSSPTNSQIESSPAQRIIANSVQ